MLFLRTHHARMSVHIEEYKYIQRAVGDEGKSKYLDI
jgi:hypothetical protein